MPGRFLLKEELLRERVGALDGIRGIAILMVLAFHAFVWRMPGDVSELGRVVTAYTRYGWLGVDLFFVLSGFLITGVLLDTRERPRYFRNFYARRALRILPLYYLCVVAIAILYRGAGPFVAACVLYVPNLAPLVGVPLLYGPLWSLAVEEHFYLAWPWLVRRFEGARLGAAVIVVCAAEPIARAIGHAVGADTRMYTWFRLDGLAWGALGAMIVRSPRWRERLPKVAGRLAASGLALLAIGLPFGILTRSRLVGAALEYVPFYALFLAGILAAVDGRPRGWSRLLSFGPLRRCGDYSYFIYLFHELGFTLFGRVLPDDRFDRVVLRLVVVIPCCFIAAAISYRYFEQPILALKRKFAVERASADHLVAMR
ncbi:MAG TPA: acyltransferase [Polyangia bacterium]